MPWRWGMAAPALAWWRRSRPPLRTSGAPSGTDWRCCAASWRRPPTEAYPSRETRRRGAPSPRPASTCSSAAAAGVPPSGRLWASWRRLAAPPSARIPCRMRRGTGVERLQLAAVAPDRLLAGDAQRPGLAPERLGLVGRPAALPQRPQQRLPRRPLVQRPDARADAQDEAGEALRVLLLGELVVERAPAEARGQHFLEEPHHLAPHQGDALTGQPAVAADLAQVIQEPVGLQRAATGAALQDAVVAGFEVEQQLGGGGDQRSEGEGPDADP